MSISRIASRYAKSLLDLAIERDQVEPVLENIRSFKKATSNRDLYLLLKSPIINTGKKSQIIDALFGKSFDELTIGFIRIILNKGREMYLPEIADEFIVQYKKYKHISTVKLTTAVPLEVEVVSSIKQKLVASAVTDDNIEIKTVVDPDIIGGFILEFDDKLYDSSIAHKLATLKKEFAKNDYIKNF
ncbi:MAG: ATP synthase F1 subunit delta [Bacteroidota bacterium]